MKIAMIDEKSKLIINRQEWEAMGKKAGWEKGSQSAFTGYQHPPTPYKGNKSSLIAHKIDSSGKHFVVEYEINSGYATGPDGRTSYHPARGGLWSMFCRSEQEAQQIIAKYLTNPKYKEVPYDVLMATLNYYNKKNKVPELTTP